MFKDTKEGQTHSYNDGCGEPAHNSPEQPKQEEWLEDLWYHVHNWKEAKDPEDIAKSVRALERFVSSLESRTRVSALEEAISYIGKEEGWEESEDIYRKHFGLPTKYTK